MIENSNLTRGEHNIVNKKYHFKELLTNLYLHEIINWIKIKEIIEEKLCTSAIHGIWNVHNILNYMSILKQKNYFKNFMRTI